MTERYVISLKSVAAVVNLAGKTGISPGTYECTLGLLKATIHRAEGDIDVTRDWFDRKLSDETIAVVRKVN
jgi:hypothetical protein